MALRLAGNVCLALVQEISLEEPEKGELDILHQRLKEFSVKVGEEYMRFFQTYVVGKD